MRSSSCCMVHAALTSSPFSSHFWSPPLAKSQVYGVSVGLHELQSKQIGGRAALDIAGRPVGLAVTVRRQSLPHGSFKCRSGTKRRIRVYRQLPKPPCLQFAQTNIAYTRIPQRDWQHFKGLMRTWHEHGGQQSRGITSANTRIHWNA